MTGAGAACHGAPAELFFPEDEDGNDDYDNDRTRQVITDYCGRCPIREACLQAGRTEDYGVWGGTTPAERRRMRKRGEL